MTGVQTCALPIWLETAENTCLLGRFAKIDFNNLYEFIPKDKKFNDYGYNGEVKVVSFWNKNVDIYNKQLKPCMVALQKYEGFLELGDMPIFISSPVHKLKYMPDVIGGGGMSSLSDEEKERIAMHQRLHLAVGHEKKMLMDKLGLGWSDRGDGRKRWRDEMMKLGMGPYFHQSEVYKIDR